MPRKKKESAERYALREACEKAQDALSNILLERFDPRIQNAMIVVALEAIERALLWNRCSPCVVSGQCRCCGQREYCDDDCPLCKEVGDRDGFV